MLIGHVVFALAGCAAIARCASAASSGDGPPIQIRQVEAT